MTVFYVKYYLITLSNEILNIQNKLLIIIGINYFERIFYAS